MAVAGVGPGAPQIGGPGKVGEKENARPVDEAASDGPCAEGKVRESGRAPKAVSAEPGGAESSRSPERRRCRRQTIGDRRWCQLAPPGASGPESGSAARQGAALTEFRPLHFIMAERGSGLHRGRGGTSAYADLVRLRDGDLSLDHADADVSEKRPELGEAARMAAVLPARAATGASPSAVARDTQSMAFFNAPVMEPLYSGDAMIRPSCERNSSLSLPLSKTKR